MQLSLGRSLHGTAAAFFVLAAGSAASVYLSLIGMAQDGRVVNLAGVVRGGSQVRGKFFTRRVTQHPVRPIRRRARSGRFGAGQ